MKCTAWKVSKYEVISCPQFPVFGLNTEIYSRNTKYGLGTTPYLDTFHAVISKSSTASPSLLSLSISQRQINTRGVCRTHSNISNGLKAVNCCHKKTIADIRLGSKYATEHTHNKKSLTWRIALREMQF